MECYIFCVLQTQYDVTVVIEDYSAIGSNELTLHRGQQVEVLDAAPGQADYCLVRTVPVDGTDPVQGLAPMCALKPVASLRVSGSRTSIDGDGKILLYSYLLVYFFGCVKGKRWHLMLNDICLCYFKAI